MVENSWWDNLSSGVSDFFSIDSTVSPSGNMKADDACRYIVRVLHLASKKDNEIRLGRFIMQQLNTGRLPSLFDCQERFQQQTRDKPQLQVEQHSLKQYGLLLQGGRND